MTYQKLNPSKFKNQDELLNGAVFTEDADQMLLIQDIDIFSSCEHHILPIIGHAHVAYIPNGKVKGATSGHIQKVKELFYDSNGDPLLLKIEQVGDIACYTGARSCFFKDVQIYSKF